MQPASGLYTKYGCYQCLLCHYSCNVPCFPLVGNAQTCTVSLCLLRMAVSETWNCMLNPLVVTHRKHCMVLGNEALFDNVKATSRSHSAVVTPICLCTLTSEKENQLAIAMYYQRQIKLEQRSAWRRHD